MNKKNLLFFFAFPLISACSSIGLDPHGAPDNSTYSGGIEPSFYGEAEVIKIYPKDRNNGEIKGICFIASSPNSFFDLSCTNIRFELQDLNSRVVATSQTDEQGRFRFQIPKKKRYRLVVKSDKYKTLSDEIVLRAGADVLVRSIQKL